MKLLDNKLALITGAAGGLGKAIAQGFVDQGARVILADTHEGACQNLAHALQQQGHTAWAHALDVTDRDAVHAWAQKVTQELGPIDVLINNAGISGRASTDDPQAQAVWDRILDVNLNGLLNVTHAFVPALKQTKGCIVSLSSIVAYVSAISSVGYIASKGAVRSVTQAFARDLAPYGVRANAVAPGLMLTEMVAPQLAIPGGTDWYMSRVPLKRGGEPQEIVGPIVFLASDMASYVNGAVLPVDGGFLSA